MRAKQLKDLGPPEDVEYIERERHAVAVHEACHAVVAYRTRRHMEIDIATIEKGSDYLGMVASIPPEDQFTRWRSEYEADILRLARLAGRGADVLRGRLVVRGLRRPGVGHRGGLVHGGLLGHGLHGVVLLDGAAAGGRQPRRRPWRAAEGREHREGAAPGARRPDRGPAGRAARAGRGDPAREPRPRCWPSRTRWRRTRRSPARTSRPCSRGGRAPRWTARVYGDPQFAARLEEYHAAAAGAHRGHTAVTLALPAGGHLAQPQDGESAAAVPHGSR